MPKTPRERALLALALLFLAGCVLQRYGRTLWYPTYAKLRGRRTVGEAVATFAPAADARLAPALRAAGVGEAPSRLLLLALKRERWLELWAEPAGGGWVLVKRYAILGASGRAGPKLREGDLQVPEGLYRIEGLNPNSSYHLSMKVDYPNAFDREHARREGRSRPGSDIFIHGGMASIGCLAMGDPAIEELFTLVARVGHERVEVVIAPSDPRAGALSAPEGAPGWVGDLYRRIEDRVAALDG